MYKELLSNEVEIAFVLEGLVEFDYVGMIQFPEDINLVHKHFRVSDCSFIDDFDNSISVWGLFQLSFEDSTITTSSNWLNQTTSTFG